MAKYCNKCNSPIEEGGVFCTECGSNDIRDDSPVTTPMVTVPVTEPVTQPVTVPETVPETVPISGSTENSSILVPIPNSESDIPKTEPETVPETVPQTTAPVSTPIDNIEAQIPAAVENAYNKEETHTGSFADVPEFMNGGESTTTPPVTQQEQIAPAAITTQNPNMIVKGPKKKNNSKLIIAAITCVAVICIVVGVVVFLQPDKSISKDPFSSEDLSNTGTGRNTFDYTKIFTPQNSFRVGDKVFGFISIPNTWAQFAQTEGNKALQYTDSEDWVVTLYAIPTSQSSAYEYANEIYNSVLKSPAEDVKTEKTNVAGYAALSISAYYPEQAKYLTTWFFETKSGYTHYLAIEGPEDDGDNYNIIYSFKEDE